MTNAQDPAHQPKRYMPVIVVAIVAIAIAAGIFFRNSFSGGLAPAASTTSATPLNGDGMLQQPTDQSASQASKAMPASGSRGQQGLTASQRMEQVRARREEMRAATAKRNEAGRQKRLAKFNSEGKDPGWASTTERNLDNVISEERLATYGVKAADMKVECRTTTCRITSILPDISQADDWTTLYMTNVGSSLPNAYVTRKTLPDGRIQVEVIGTGGRN